MEPGLPSPHIDTSLPHPARMYDYYLGGTDNCPADREAAEAVLRVVPVVREAARRLGLHPAVASGRCAPGSA